MFVATVIVSVLLALLLVFSAVGKLRRQPAIVESLTSVGVKPEQLPQLAALEIAAALGLVIGLFWAPLGIAAAIGVILYFIGAITAHLRAGQRGAQIAAPLPFLVFGIVALVLRFASL